LVYYATFPLRAWRWRLLLKNAGEHRVPSLWRLTQILLINWFANAIVYGRLGDAYRAYLLRMETGAGFTRAVGTVVAERIMDLMVIVSLTLLAGLGAWRESEWTALPFLGLGLLSSLGVFLLVAAWLGPWLATILPPRLGQIMASLQQGVLGSFRQLPFIALLSIAIWLLETARFFLIATALDLKVNPMLLLFTAQAVALLVALPLTPGGIGIVEPGVAGILMLALPREAAWSVAILDRTVSYLSLIVVGLTVLLAREFFRLKGVAPRKLPNNKEEG
ncbi:MAG: lysylphosphatidylglycerol synthase transmembrane domain-containing protein, partial [Dehalococcoidia bacterium]|nr:lysylphosphatidylglycerol synthase transmembrane domain-containing protein [Dehalococcoidia bacterium]